LLALRYPSDLARDLPQEVYGNSIKTVVTYPRDHPGEPGFSGNPSNSIARERKPKERAENRNKIEGPCNRFKFKAFLFYDYERIY
jgi:hypothetical protein